MALLGRADDARTLIQTTLRTAWSFAAGDRVIQGRPLLPETSYPYAVISLQSVPREATGVRTVSETYEFEVAGAFAWTTGTDLEESKRSKASALGDALLIAGWAAIDCYDPRVTRVDFIDDNDTEPYYGVTITFRVTSDVTQ